MRKEKRIVPRGRSACAPFSDPGAAISRATETPVLRVDYARSPHFEGRTTAPADCRISA
jgi:hypothetical protein